MRLPNVTINPISYFMAHGEKPHGFGAWAFEINGKRFEAMGLKSYATAAEEAKRFARRHHAAEVRVLP